MPYWIWVFNLINIDEIDEEGLSRALAGSHLETLCDQYNLDRALIAPSIQNLRVVAVNTTISPFFLLFYRPKGERPLVIHSWNLNQGQDAGFWKHFLEKSQPVAVEGHLSQTRTVFGISLSSDQLQEMGLVFGYEVARWAAAQGGGLIRGLDGLWYRLNIHQAFIPLGGHQSTGS